MAIFNKSKPDKIAALRASVEKLDEQIAAAEVLVGERRAAAVKTAREGADTATRRAANIEVERAETDVKILEEARRQTASELAEAEKKAADDASIKLHAEDAAAKENARAKWMERGAIAMPAVADWLAAGRDMHWVPECVPFDELLEQLLAQSWPPSIEAINTSAQHIASQVRARKMPAYTAPPVLVASAPPPPPEPRTAWFALAPVKYRHGDDLKLVARYDIATLTIAQRDTGLRLQVICALDDERVASLRRKQVTQITQQHYCTDLDTGEKPAGIVMMDVPKPATYHLPPSFTPKASSDVQLPKVAARSEHSEQ